MIDLYERRGGQLPPITVILTHELLKNIFLKIYHYFLYKLFKDIFLRMFFFYKLRELSFFKLIKRQFSSNLVFLFYIISDLFGRIILKSLNPGHNPLKVWCAPQWECIFLQLEFIGVQIADEVMRFRTVWTVTCGSNVTLKSVSLVDSVRGSLKGLMPEGFTSKKRAPF